MIRIVAEKLSILSAFIKKLYYKKPARSIKNFAQILEINAQDKDESPTLSSSSRRNQAHIKRLIIAQKLVKGTNSRIHHGDNFAERVTEKKSNPARGSGL